MHLNLGNHFEFGEPFEQLARIGVVRRAEQRRIEGDADDAPRDVDDEIVDADFEDLGEDKRK